MGIPDRYLLGATLGHDPSTEEASLPCLVRINEFNALDLSGRIVGSDTLTRLRIGGSCSFDPYSDDLSPSAHQRR